MRLGERTLVPSPARFSLLPRFRIGSVATMKRFRISRSIRVKRIREMSFISLEWIFNSARVGGVSDRVSVSLFLSFSE